MITYKNRLQKQIKNLQSLINDISELELEEKLSIGGVIVDLTCNSINTNSLMINGVDIYESFSDKVINAANITSLKTVTIEASGNITSKNLNTSDLQASAISVKSINMSSYLYCYKFNLQAYMIDIFQCNIEIRDYPKPNTKMYDVNGLALKYNNKLIFLYCSFITSSSYTNYTQPAVWTPASNGYNLYIKLINVSGSVVSTNYIKLKYITGVVYDESYSSMIYQYDSSMGNSYDPYLLRENNNKGVFNRAGVCVEFKYAEIA